MLRVLPSLLALCVALALGFAGGRYSHELGDRRPEASPADPADRLGPGVASDGSAPDAGGPTLTGRAAPGGEAMAALQAERDALARRVEAQDAEIARLRTRDEKHGEGPTFTFGAGGDLEGVREADWGALAAASQEIHGGLKTMLAALEAGEPVPKDVAVALQRNVERMRVYEYRTLDKLPTAAKHNGELTHPISVTNLFAALLDEAGVPLRPEQVDAIAALGLVVEDELAAVLAGPGPRVRRLVAEYRVKQAFLDDLREILDERQREVVVDPETHGIAGLDLYDPTLILIHTSPVLAADTEAEVIANLRDLLRHKWNVGDDQAARLDAMLDTWRDRVRPLLEPTTKLRVKYYPAEVAGAAGDATVELVETALRDLQLSDTARTALENDPSIYVPRLIAR